MQSTKQVVGRFSACAVLIVPLLLGMGGACPRAERFRGIPAPMTGHPGNIFLMGEEVEVSIPAAEGWRLFDYEDKRVNEKEYSGPRARLGTLPPGFYRLKSPDPKRDWVSLAVIPKLKAPTPLTSPVGLDVAMAWFYGREKMDAVASLCSLAGVSWVRDRLNWAQMEPQRGKFASSNQYDAAIVAQNRAGLQILQVNHISPAWASPKSQRFPTDLRDTYRFHREMARRWHGEVQAFEPWNEADITMFGGHTGSEMASFQKASWLGLKAGNPGVVASCNVFAMHNNDQLQDFRDNEATAYFDTMNFHHYAPLKDFPTIYKKFRELLSAGKPLWITECNMPVKWAGEEKLKEPTEGDLRVQAERVAKIFAVSLYEGSAVTYYFMLPHYVESQTQFGIIRPDLTPRPAFLALAAVGRLLADAMPRGRLVQTEGGATAYLFSAKPDGIAREVLVVWGSTNATGLKLPATPQAAFDHIGREGAATATPTVNQFPQFFVFEEGTFKPSSLESPPKAPALEDGPEGSIVLQLVTPAEKTILSRSCYRVLPSGAEKFQVYGYNFSPDVAQGTLKVTAPEGWKVTLPAEVTIGPGERKELALEVQPPGDGSTNVVPVRISGQFGSQGDAVLSVRFKPETAK